MINVTIEENWNWSLSKKCFRKCRFKLLRKLDIILILGSRRLKKRRNLNSVSSSMTLLQEHQFDEVRRQLVVPAWLGCQNCDSKEIKNLIPSVDSNSKRRQARCKTWASSKASWVGEAQCLVHFFSSNFFSPAILTATLTTLLSVQDPLAQQ